MKLYKIILFSSLILSIYSRNDCTLDIDLEASSPKDCEKLELVEGTTYCCFLKGTVGGTKTGACISLGKAEYKDIDGTIDLIEEDGFIKVDKLDCKSIYLELSILSFIFLLL